MDEVAGHTKDNVELNLIVSAVPIKNDQGEVVSVFEIHRNVSDEAKIHGKYTVLLDKEKRAKEEAEKLVEIRTKELRLANEELKRTEAQLVHSEKMSSLGQMVAGLAHELNNPINFISGNIDVMEEYVSDLKKGFDELQSLKTITPKELKGIDDQYEFSFKLEDLKSIAQSVRNGCTRAADVITGLRTFSRLDEAELKETNIHQDIDMTLTLLKSQFKDRITIHKQYDDFKSFKCFSSQLNQVYMNLLQNAIHAIKGEGDIWISTKLIKDKELIISIKDSGQGIEEDKVSKIFDPFFTTKPVGEGTGLGLSVSYGIVQKHGGRIEVQSKVGEGALFRIVLPIVKEKNT